MGEFTRSSSLAAGLLVTMLALPAVAGAQRQLEPVRVTAATEARADALYEKATKYVISSMRDFPKVARWHEQSAALRRASDARRFESFAVAAALRYGVGDRSRAGDDMEQAAHNAAARGDVVNAANAYIDAAFIAAELRQGERAREFAGTAQLLSGSPLLTAEQRNALRARLPQALQVAAAAQAAAP